LGRYTGLRAQFGGVPKKCEATVVFEGTAAVFLFFCAIFVPLAPAPSSRVLITGANGFLGATLARALLADGMEVRCLVRPHSDTSLLDGIKHTIVSGDVCESQSLPPVMREVDVVYHLAGVRRETSRAAFFKTNVHGTELVARAMVESGVRRLVFCGSLAASGPATATNPKREDEPFAPAEWYGESKAEAERVAFSFSKVLEVTAIRPARILGPGDKENLPFFRLAKRGLVFRLLGAPRLLSLIDVDDVVAQMRLQGELPQAVGQAYFSASAETMSIEDMMRQMAATFGVRPRVIPIAPLMLRGAAVVADAISNRRKKKLPLNSKLANQLLAKGWCCSVEKAQRELGFRAKVSLGESLRRSAASYVQAGLL
jgi:dihydroflavonol-4-reductase